MKKSLTISLFFFIFLYYSVNAFAGTNVYFFEDMDNLSFPPAGWTVTNTAQYNWIRTSYCSGYGQGSASAMCDFYDYVSGNLDLVTKNFSNGSIPGDSLSFDHAYATAVGGYNDRLDIYTSSNGGTSWTLLVSLVGGNSGPLVTAPATNHLFVPTSSQWATKRYALPTGTNKLKFEGVTAFGNNLYLDNVRVGTRYSIDVGASAITSPKWGMTPGIITPQAQARNFGTTAQTFTVTMTVNPGGYTNTMSVTNLAPGATQLLTFPNTTLSSYGTYTVKAYSNSASDPNHYNDTTSSTVVVTPAPRSAVLEYITGTWCQWCPCGDNEAHNLITAYPNTVILAYHGGGGGDPWLVYNGSGIISAFGFPGYPSGLIDRRYGSVNSGWGSFFTDGEYRYSQSPAGTVNLQITNVSYNSGTRVLTVNLNATALATLTGQYKVHYIITENNLVYNQTGNSYCPGSSTWIHNWVTRDIVNGVSGTNVNSGTWNINQTYPLTFTSTLGAAWISTNCKFNVVLYRDNGGLSTSDVQQGVVAAADPPVGIHNGNNGIPVNYELAQNYPNPFNPTTNIHFSIPKEGIVSLKIYNSLGQVVGTYLDGFVKAGFYNAEIDASDYASGIYYYTLTAANFTETKKMILIK